LLSGNLPAWISLRGTVGIERSSGRGSVGIKRSSSRGSIGVKRSGGRGSIGVDVIVGSLVSMSIDLFSWSLILRKNKPERMDKL